VQLPSISQLGPKFRLLKIEDTQEILDWRNVPEVFKFTSSGAPISSESHRKWMEMRIGKLSQEPIFIMEKDLRLGMFRVDSIVNRPTSLEISILVSPNCFGLGIGSEMMKLYFENHAPKPPVEYFARIHRDNIKSQRFFEKHNFFKLSEENQFFRFQRKAAHD
jgi:RimJ/RimL family protein N-acetyltransferase